MKVTDAFVSLILVVTAIAVTCHVPASAQPEQAAAGRTFASPDDAVAALIAALRSDEPAAIQAILGSGSAKLVSSGDKVADAQGRQRFLAAYEEKHQLVAVGPERMIVQVGKDDWPLPLPLQQQAGRWHFDATAGAQELVARRIGRNELAAIRTALAYVDAQKAYFAASGQYAQRLVSSPGTHDGLYWPAAADEPESPLEPLVAQAQEEGYPGGQTSGKPVPYQGYFFRILMAQGTSAPEGAQDYVDNGRMTKGFALIAWPASFGASGIMSFIVNQDGIVFQKDLGPGSAASAANTKLYDPDLTWTRIDLVN